MENGAMLNHKDLVVGAAGLEPATLGLEVVKTPCDSGRPSFPDCYASLAKQAPSVEAR